MTILKSLTLVAGLMFGAAGVSAQSFEKGVAAYDSGDFQTAIAEWLPLAEQDNAAAQYNLGLMYLEGNGVPQDRMEAIKWFRLAGDQGNEAAQYFLGLSYSWGISVPQDYAEAIKWYRLAADQGNAKAQGSLGGMYHSGNGVPQDYAQAIKWYRLAADQGDEGAQGNLGLMYQNGDGVLQDNVMAHMWYNIASANGFKLSAEWRDTIAAKMTPEDISKAQAMASACMSSGYESCGW
jgi:TPR repeat protein